MQEISTTHLNKEAPHQPWVQQSAATDQLAAALSKFHGEAKNVVRDTKAHTHKYATLDQVLEMACPILSKFELALMQMPVPGVSKNHVGLWTSLMHSSGQWRQGFFEMPVVEQKGANASQIVGTTISYMRRYTAAAVLGVAQTDTDAASVSIDNTTAKALKIAPKATPQQLEELEAECLGRESTREWILDKCKVTTLNDLSESAAQQCLTLINNKKQKILEQQATLAAKAHQNAA